MIRSPADNLRAALDDPSSSARLQAALDAGTRPAAEYVEVLVAQCSTESDFYVREMLTWSLMRHPATLTVPRLIAEVRDRHGQARIQALHSLSKIADPAGWAAITPELLDDPDDDVKRTAWRAAVVLAPESSRPALAVTLTSQLGRGGHDLQLSLSRSLATLGDLALPALDAARAHADPEVQAHALATQRQIVDPDEGFDAAMHEARRAIARDRPRPTEG